MAQIYQAAASAARRMAALRHRSQDPVSYAAATPKRADALFAAYSQECELADIIERESIDRVVRVKNTSGGAWAAGTLLYLPTAKLTAQPTGTATAVAAPGASVVISITGTAWEVGMIVKITDGTYTDYAIITALSSNASITVDALRYTYTTPTVTALPAYEAAAADADAGLAAQWVTPAAIANGAYGFAAGAIEVTALDTHLLSAEALVYLSATPGLYTVYAPVGADQISQVVGVVKVSDVSVGSILFFPGARRITVIGTSQLQGSSVPYNRIQNVSATDKVLGRSTAGAGTVEEIPCVAGARAFLAAPKIESIVGVTDASAGTQYNAGEALRGDGTGGVNLSTTGTYYDVASIQLTAGDWDVSAVCAVKANGSVCTFVDVGIGTASGNSGSGIVIGDNAVEVAGPVGSVYTAATIASFRVNITGAAQYRYLKAYAGFTGGPTYYPIAYGRISARRVR